MIVKHELNEAQKDIEVFITYPQKTPFVVNLLKLVKSADTQISCRTNDKAVFVNASDIYYIESVDRKTIINCEKNILYTNEPLYKIFERLENIGFYQINKYSIVNLNILDIIKQLPNSHLEAILKNGKQLYVTRKYLNDLKHILRGRH